MNYTELQVVSNFSFLRGGSHPEELIQQAAYLGYRSVALADYHSLAGIVRAQVAAEEVGLRLLVGATVLPRNALPEFENLEEPFPSSALLERNFLPLLLYPTDRASYGRLCKLLTRGKQRAPKGECYLLFEDVCEFSDGLQGVFALQRTNRSQAVEAISSLLRSFPRDALSLGISRSYGPQDDETMELACTLAREFELSLVATNDVHYHHPERAMLQDVLTCIRIGTTIHEAGYHLFANHERYLKPPQEMERLFRSLPQAIRRSEEIAERAAGFSLRQVQYHYPHEIIPAGFTALEYLRQETWKGAKQKFPEGVPEKVSKLIEYELQLIEELKYEEYFLTVYDIVTFARSQDILCQGRGSAANSAVCFCLGITSVNPGEMEMLFERFVSKERREPPDIDVDFEHERREEVIQYVYNKYGRHRAAIVAEVITYRGRSAIRDVGKALGLSLDCVNALASAISRWESREVRLELLKSAGLNTDDQAILTTLKLMQTLLGFPRHLSQHVGGFVIANDNLSEIVPIENAAMEDRTVIEWDKDDIDALGMLKVDVLALGMLTAIRKMFEFINSTNPSSLEEDLLRLHKIPADDPDVYKMISRADTIGVFQIESRAQMSMLPRHRPEKFYDLVIQVAIVRPGPIQGNMVHPYLRRRAKQEEAVYPDERIRAVLERTLGVPLFQEQAMQLAIVGAGFTPGEADQLRRAIAGWKRNSKLLLAFHDRIMSGMRSQGYSEEFAVNCFEQIKGFSGYGFPESHAASFALLAYTSSWLKHHYPAAFTAGLLNSQPMGFYQPAQLIRDAQNHQVEVRPIDIHFSNWDCTLEGGALRLGMRLVRGLKKQEAEKIVQTRTRLGGKFLSLRSLWRESGVSTKTLRALAAADAFHSLQLSRQTALWQIQKLKDHLLPLLEQIQAEDDDSQLPLLSEATLVLQDYAQTGFSLKAHPVSFLRPLLERHQVLKTQELYEKERWNRSNARIAGMVLVRQQPETASGLIFMTIEDETGIANLLVRREVYEQYRPIIRQSTFILAYGSVQGVEGVVHVLVRKVEDLSRAFLGYSSQSRDFH